MNKRTHSSARIRAALRIISRAQAQGGKRKQYHGAWIDGPTGAAFTDGYTLVRLCTDAPELPHVEPGGQFDPASFFARAAKSADKNGWAQLELPTVPELKEWIRDHGGRRAAQNASYTLGGAVLVNPAYLLDVLEILGPGARAALPASPCEPVIIWANVERQDGADAILYPILPSIDKHGDAARAVIDFWDRRR